MIDQAGTLRQMVKQRQIKEGSIPPTCKIITITSGKKGAGKTNIAANLAIAFSLIHKRVLILDTDLGVNMVMGLVPPPKYNLSHVLTGEKNITEILADGPCGVKIITGVVGVTRISPTRHKQFIEHLSGLFDSFDIIIIDTSSNILSFILAANEVILITTPQPEAITEAYGIIKAAASKRNDISIKLVINRVHNIMEGKKIANKIVNLAEQFLNVKVKNIGYLLDDPLVAKAVKEQEPFFLAYPRSKATNCIYHIRNKLSNIPDESRGVTEFFKRLFGSNGNEGNHSDYASEV